MATINEKAIEIRNYYKTNFESLIFALANVAGSSHPRYTTTFQNEVLKTYEKKYSSKTIKRLVKTNEIIWCKKGYKIDFDYDLISKYL